MTEDNIQHLEVQLAGWQKSDSQGRPPMVKLILQSDEDAEFFEQFTVAKGSKSKPVAGQIFDVAICISDQDDQSKTNLSEQILEEEPVKGDYSWVAQALHRIGFFRAPPVWKALGTDDQFRAWVQKQPCIISGDFDYVELTPGGGLERRCEACHVRRSGESGTSYKGEYACVPMKHDIHASQHKFGETHAYGQYLNNQNRVDGIISEQTAKDWFDKKRLETVEAWAHHMLCKHLCIDSLTQATPNMLTEFCVANALINYLPAKIREVTCGRV